MLLSLLLCVMALVAPGTAAAGQGDIFEPVPQAECQHLRELADKALKARFTLTPDAPFLYRTGDAANEKDETGRGCTLTATGTGRDFPGTPVALDIKLRRAFQGWKVTDTMFYGDYEPCGGRSALTRGDQLLVIEAGWDPTPEAEALAEKKCPESPAFTCVQYFKPAQLLYTIKIHIARRTEARQ